MKIPSSKFCKFFAYVETKHELHEVKRAQTYTQFESDLFGIQWQGLFQDVFYVFSNGKPIDNPVLGIFETNKNSHYVMTKPIWINNHPFQTFE